MGIPVIQVSLQIKTEKHVSEMITWIDQPEKMKVGRQITLRGEDGRKWTIIKVGDTVVDSDTLYQRGREKSTMLDSIRDELKKIE